MKLSLSGFLFEEEYLHQSLAFPDFCRLARSAGYEGVELRRTQVDPRTPARVRRELREIVEDHGLRVSCLTARGMPRSGRERDLFFAEYLELCRDMGCGLLKLGGEPEWLLEAADEAAAHGVVLASNNHIGGPLETVEGTRAHLDAVLHPHYGLLYDCLHLRLAGQDYLGCIPELYDRIRNVLVHSMRPARAEEEPELVYAGRGWVKCLPDEEGAQDWPAVLGTFGRMGYDGWITVIESGWPRTQREQVARHVGAFLRQIRGRV